MNRIDLKNTTFMIPIRIDHNDRLENINVVLDYLNYNLDTNIIVCEESDTPKLQSIINGRAEYIYQYSNDRNFHRTKILNYMLKLSKTPVVVNYDADVLLRPCQYEWSQNQILNNGYDMIYPYSGMFCHVPRSMIPKIIETMSIEHIKLEDVKQNSMANSLGAAIFFNRESYISGGMENENFMNYGWEDDERFSRFTTLGYKIDRYKNDNVIHLYHYRGINSNLKHGLSEKNKCEFNKVKSMDKGQLRRYIDTWSWVK